MQRKVARLFILLALSLGIPAESFASFAQTPLTPDSLQETIENRKLLKEPFRYLRLSKELIDKKRRQVLQTLLFQNFRHLGGKRYTDHLHVEMFLENAIWIWGQPGPDRLEALERVVKKVSGESEPKHVSLPACEYLLTKSAAFGDDAESIREEADHWAAMTLALQLIGTPTHN